MESIKDEKITLLVTHAPPYATKTDLLPSGDHAGSKSLRRVIEELQPTLNICGHIHESRGTDKIGQTLVINPGQMDEGYACLINVLEDDKSKLETKIIKLEV